MKKNVEIIPTMAIYDSFDKYKEIMRFFVSESIDLIRINMTRFEPERYISEIPLIKKAYREFNQKSELKILLDVPIPGRKPRVAFDGTESRRYIYKGNTIHLTSKKDKMDVENNIFVVDDNEFITYLDINKSKYLYFDDGKLKCQIVNINDNCVEAIAENDGVISFLKSVYTDGYYFCHMIKRDLEDYLNAINAIKPEYLALSFVEQVNDVIRIKEYLKTPIKIVSKIETPEGVNNISNIIRVSDAIMIGRGDLAITSGLAYFGELHTKLLKYSNCIDIYVATDILQSIVDSEFPNRADIIDITSLIECNVRGLVTSGKIARGLSLRKFISIVNEIKGRYQ